MSTWRNKQKAELQKHLYSTAITLFTDEGYEQTSVSLICKEAGVAKGTFFNYFSSKESVLSQYMRDITAEALEKSRREIKDSAEETVLNTVQNLFAQAEKNLPLFFTVCRISPHNAELQEEEVKLDDDIVSFVLEQISDDVKKGTLPSTLETDVLGSIIIAVLTATAHEWAANGDDFPAKREIERRIRFLFLAARSEKGRAENV